LIATFQVGQFLNALGISIEPAVTDDFSGNNLSVVNCSNALSFGAIILKPFSNQTRVYVDEKNPHCVILEAENCSVVEVSERYIFALMQAYKKPDQFGELFKNYSSS
jgi:hypothetical protein